MSREVHFEAEAQVELEEAAQWYEQQRDALTGWLERGDLQAWGYSDQRHTRDYLFWCLSDDCSPYPRPSFTN